MSNKKVSDPRTSGNVLDVILDELADRVAARLGARPRFYSTSALPPDCPSGRALRDRCRKLGVPTTKAGREVLVDASVYDAAVAARTIGATRRTVTSSDANALEAMGLVLPIARRAS